MKEGGGIGEGADFRSSSSCFNLSSFAWARTSAISDSDKVGNRAFNSVIAGIVGSWGLGGMSLSGGEDGAAIARAIVPSDKATAIRSFI